MRLFIATTFPNAATAPLNAGIAILRASVPHASWVKPDAQHLTFAFLGEQEGGIVQTIAPLLHAALAPLAPFEASLDGCGFFPNAQRARVGWIGVEPVARFQSIAATVRKALSSAGIETESKELEPHLTVVRIRDPWEPSSIEQFASALADFKSPSFTVETVSLYESALKPHGAVHTVLKEFALNGVG
ncbi:MAG: RNA 2',3'-cyclic phosphodiesterase [Acidobacteriota bacterium]